MATHDFDEAAFERILRSGATARSVLTSRSTWTVSCAELLRRLHVDLCESGHAPYEVLDRILYTLGAPLPRIPRYRRPTRSPWATAPSGMVRRPSERWLPITGRDRKLRSFVHRLG